MPFNRQASNTTPEQARPSAIPVMTEPDPCPFEQAASLSGSFDEEKGFDLLENVEGSTEGRRQEARGKVDDFLTTDDLKNTSHRSGSVK